MSGHWEGNNWVDTVRVDAGISLPDKPYPETPPTTTEPTIEEHASMLRQGFEKLVNKAVEGTELARRVSELEGQLQGLVNELRLTRDDLGREVEEHGKTRGQLQEVEAKLAQRESTVHDLVLERDIVIGERNAAQAERDEAKNEAKRLQNDVDFLNQRVMEVTHGNDVLSERNEMLTQKIAGIRTAFAALNEA